MCGEKKMDDYSSQSVVGHTITFCFKSSYIDMRIDTINTYCVYHTVYIYVFYCISCVSCVVLFV